jgi:hypothetical protein
VTSIMPQLISAVRKFAKIDAGGFFGTIHGSRNRVVPSPGGSAGFCSGAGGPHDALYGDLGRVQEHSHTPAGEVMARANKSSMELACTAVSLNADPAVRAPTALSNADAT